MVLPFGSFLVTRFPTLSYVPAKLVEPLLVNSPLKSYSVCRILSKHRSGIEEELEVLFGDKAEASPELDWNQQKTRSNHSIFILTPQAWRLFPKEPLTEIAQVSPDECPPVWPYGEE